MGNLTSQALLSQVSAYRQYLHQHPEVSQQEFETSKWIQAILEAHHINILDLGLATGVVAEIGSNAGPCLALRADIDALPIQEATGLAYASSNPGIMHACGHDFHTASLLGAAILLKEREAELTGKIRLIFQPAEESNTGAKQVIAAGGLRGVDAIIGYHNTPHLPLNVIGVKAGPLFAGATHFEVTLKGTGSHAAAPHHGNDPLLAASQLISDLQSIISRYLPPFHPAVLSVTHFEAGNTWNVIPETAYFEGTARTFYPEDEALLKGHFCERITHYAKGLGMAADIQWQSSPSLNNDQRISGWVAANSQAFASLVTPEATMGGEDFAAYLEHVPGCFALIGTGQPYEWHHPAFLVDDAALTTAMDYYVVNAIQLLKQLAKAED